MTDTTTATTTAAYAGLSAAVQHALAGVDNPHARHYGHRYLTVATTCCTLIAVAAHETLEEARRWRREWGPYAVRHGGAAHIYEVARGADGLARRPLRLLSSTLRRLQ
jgi:hypothetical protein